MTADGPLVPDYGGACLSSLVPALFEPGRPAPWLPEAVRGARQVVLLVIDGLGWLQLQDRLPLAPHLAAMSGGPISSVVPSTTSTALCSIVFGTPPAGHGVLGYRVNAGAAGVLNVLRWQTTHGDARQIVPPAGYVGRPAFGGRGVPVVTRAEFAGTGFTAVMLAGTRLVGWYAPSTIAVEVRRLLREGHELVYAYYDGLDKIAHAHGLDEHYDAELGAVDALVAAVADALVPGAALVVTADHGQVDVGDDLVRFDEEIAADVALLTGESRLRWLHAKEGRAAALADACRRYEDDGTAWVRTVDEAEAEGWFGGPLGPVGRSRVGDVAVAARRPVGLADPADHLPLRCRHGSLTAEEMLVPLVGEACPGP